MKKIATLLAASFPFIASAQIYVVDTPSQGVTDANSLIGKAGDLANTAVWVLVSLAFLFVVWNAFQFVRNASNPEKRGEYQNAILWGIVGLFVILSIWGLVKILHNTLGTDVTADAPDQTTLQNLVPRRPNANSPSSPASSPASSLTSPAQGGGAQSIPSFNASGSMAPTNTNLSNPSDPCITNPDDPSCD